MPDMARLRDPANLVPALDRIGSETTTLRLVWELSASGGQRQCRGFVVTEVRPLQRPCPGGRTGLGRCCWSYWWPRSSTGNDAARKRPCAARPSAKRVPSPPKDPIGTRTSPGASCIHAGTCKSHGRCCSSCWWPRTSHGYAAARSAVFSTAGSKRVYAASQGSDRIAHYPHDLLNTC
jgi:hypothetical protein